MKTATCCQEERDLCRAFMQSTKQIKIPTAILEIIPRRQGKNSRRKASAGICIYYKASFNIRLRGHSQTTLTRRGRYLGGTGNVSKGISFC